jgi:DNA-binding response OmpR family regulator
MLGSNKIRAVVVEDDPVWAAMLYFELNNRRVSCIQYGSATEFLNNLNETPTLAFIDLELNDPNDMTGASISKMIKQKWPNITIVLVSASEKVKQISKKKSSVDLIFYKPATTPDKLVSATLNYVAMGRLKKILLILSALILVLYLSLAIILLS